MGATARQDRLEGAVVAALDSVMDPELDESVVKLGFARVRVLDEGRVRVELRLPTFWCAPNFAYLMAEDAREAVAAVDGVHEVDVRLRDHFASDEVTSGVGGGRTFDDAFDGLADGAGLDGLRRLFWAKSFIVRQATLVRALLAAGRSVTEVAAMRIGDVCEGPDLAAYLDGRRRLRLPVDAEAPLVVMPGGRRIAAAELEAHLRRARSTRVNMEFNSSLCRGLLETRYAGTEEAWG